MVKSRSNSEHELQPGVSDAAAAHDCSDGCVGTSSDGVAAAAWLIMKTGDGNQRRFAITADLTTLGRGSSCDLQLALPGLRRCHCELHLQDGVITAVDPHNAASLLHNDSAVSEAVLHHGDQLHIGGVEFTIELSPAHRTAPEPHVPDIEVNVRSAAVAPASRDPQSASGSGGE